MMTETPPIACTLTAADFKTRAAAIRDLATRSLLTGRRTPLQLHLTYARDAGSRVREVVRQEQGCCAFLAFDVREDAVGVHLTITAPEEARDSADAVFAHFLPEIVQTRIQSDAS